MIVACKRHHEMEMMKKLLDELISQVTLVSTEQTKKMKGYDFNLILRCLFLDRHYDAINWYELVITLAAVNWNNLVQILNIYSRLGHEGTDNVEQSS